MVNRLVIIAGLLLTASSIKAQEKAPEVLGTEFSFTTENDAYLFQKKDAYYTNGVFLSLSKAGNKQGKKQIRNYELGQMIFTPLSKKASPLSEIDRPYCGWLFLKYTDTRFLKRESLFQYSTTFSELGPSSWGEGLQNSYHKLLGYTRFNGWQYQVRNAFGIDFGASYAQTLLENSSWYKLVPQATLNLGTTYANAAMGMYTVIGSFEKNGQSALWNARASAVGETRRYKFELFGFWYPQVIYQAYNGTIQGGLLNKGTGAVLGTPEKWLFQQSIGICYAANKWSARAAWVYQTREAVSQIRDQQYGSITVSFRLH